MKNSKTLVKEYTSSIIDIEKCWSLLADFMPVLINTQKFNIASDMNSSNALAEKANFEFSSIYQQMKINSNLTSGFNNTADEIHNMSTVIGGSLESISRDVQDANDAHRRQVNALHEDFSNQMQAQSTHMQAQIDIARNENEKNDKHRKLQLAESKKQTKGLENIAIARNPRTGKIDYSDPRW